MTGYLHETQITLQQIGKNSTYKANIVHSVLENKTNPPIIMECPMDTVSSNKTFVSETTPEIDIDVQLRQCLIGHQSKLRKFL